MASSVAHAAMALPSGIIAAAMAWPLLPPGIARFWWCAGALFMAIPGSGAPDWMELEPIRRGRGRHSWIAHRTWTHWVPAWVVLIAFAWSKMPSLPVWSLPFGFAVGGLVHLMADAPNARGLPWLLPTRRLSLNLWNSGTGDAFLVLLSWLGALLAADAAWCQGKVRDWATAQGSSWWKSVDVHAIIQLAESFLLKG